MTQEFLDSVFLHSKAKVCCKIYKTNPRTKKPRKFRRILRRNAQAEQKQMLRLAAYVITDFHHKAKTVIELNQKSNYILNQLKKIHEQ